MACRASMVIHRHSEGTANCESNSSTKSELHDWALTYFHLDNNSSVYSGVACRKTTCRKTPSHVGKMSLTNSKIKKGPM